MNTNQLKKFAQEARIKLIEQVSAKLNQVLNTQSAELMEKAAELKSLNEAIDKEGKERVIDKVAYTWFNRLIALRFMDVNGFEPLGVRVVSPADGETLPELLQSVRNGHIPDELKLNRGRITDLLLGKIPSSNAQEEVYRMVLVAACNHLHQIFPFLFERIHDYSELLLPDDLLSQYSILEDVRNGMSAEDCAEVEVLGWLYQFYISERKDEVFAAKGSVKKEDIPAATQLFTPRWIVEYMVQNTVGKLWLQNRPNSSLKQYMPYYIDSPVAQSEDFLKINSVEDITLLDQACGSGHILVYGFELLSKIYEEEGYNPSGIPQLIIEKNLFGFEIDDRAAQLAGLSLMMKARMYSRRVFRKSLKPNILCYQDLRLDEESISDTFKQIKIVPSEALLGDLKTMQDAKNLGSLIIPQAESTEIIRVLEKVQEIKTSDAFLQHHLREMNAALHQLQMLSRKYHCIADNPPYMGGGNMNKELTTYVRKNYPDSKADLMACFMESGLKALLPNGLLGMINQHSWMFLSSYEKLREKLIDHTQFDTLLHLGPRTFPEIGGEVVQNAAFTFQNIEPKKESKYIRLIDYKDSELKSVKTIDAIQNPDCEWFYTKSQKDFKKIPSYNIGYWLNSKMIELFLNEKTLKDIANPRKGLVTLNDIRFLKLWTEVSLTSVSFEGKSKEDVLRENRMWLQINKGGGQYKWYGLNQYIIRWKDNGRELKNYIIEKYNGGSYTKEIRSENLYFSPGITWGGISSGTPTFRYFPKGIIFSSSGPSAFPKEENILYILGFLNSKIAGKILSLFSPTLSVLSGDIAKMPIKFLKENLISDIVNSTIKISKQEWNSRETSWDFLQNELIRLKKEQQLSTLQSAYTAYKDFWTAQFWQLHQNEEALNKEFIQIYGLENELTPDVAIEDITILRDELDQKKLVDGSWFVVDGEKMVDSSRFVVDGEKKVDGSRFVVRGDQELRTNNYELRTKNYELRTKNYELPFDDKEIMKQFVSYAVGCMMGRYSLEKEGLILANQGETVDDYRRLVGGSWLIVDGDQELKTTNHELKTTNYQPRTTNQIDSDAIIPVLDDEWFEDDIVAQFKQFLKVSFGSESYEENLRFIETALGRNIRDYFIKDFYKDHIKRYQKRPIYWQFSSPTGVFNVLVYMHRYNRDTLNLIYNNYLREFKNKLENALEQQRYLKIEGSGREQAIAEKEEVRIQKMLLELQEYERELYKLIQAGGISIDLDDGVLVNYNRFGSIVKEVSGLNDKKTRKKVAGFEWVSFGS